MAEQRYEFERMTNDEVQAEILRLQEIRRSTRLGADVYWKRIQQPLNSALAVRLKRQAEGTWSVRKG